MQSKELINLPVFTQSGRPLGRVKDFEIDENSQEISQYIIRVKDKNFVQKIFVRELIIHRSQVIFLNREKMIVEDNLIKETGVLMEKKSIAI